VVIQLNFIYRLAIANIFNAVRDECRYGNIFNMGVANCVLFFVFASIVILIVLVLYGKKEYSRV